jgi:hypothetical protein
LEEGLVAELKDKVKLALDEARMLVLGSQVLLGFEFRSFFEQRFNDLPPLTQFLKFGALGVLLIAMLLLVLPAAYHRIVEHGEATEEQHRFTTTVMDYALLPFALVIGVDIYAAMRDIAGHGAAIGAALAMLGFTFFCWYGLEWFMRGKREGGSMTPNESRGRTPLKDKIEQVLTECRVVLPGVQALMGFQFAAILTEAFPKLPESSKQIHIASLFCIAIAMVLLMTPAAFHRIVEEGEETERLHRFASRMLLASLVPVALGVAGGFFVVARKLFGSVAVAAAWAGGAALMFFAGWFGVTIYIRIARRERALREAGAAI